MSFDPLELTKEIEKRVSKREDSVVLRKYYRFRSTRYYGGIASADCCGCNLRCIFCWSNDKARDGKIGEFYSPKEVANRLVEIAVKNGFNKVRITGNEPTLVFDHLVQVLENLPSDFLFILETNGILLGSDKGYAKVLSRFENLHVRVSLKGCDEEDFAKLTLAKPEFFELQLKALKNCLDAGVSCHPALMIDVVDRKKLGTLEEKLREIDEILAFELEFEELIQYPHVLARMRKHGFFQK